MDGNKMKRNLRTIGVSVFIFGTFMLAVARAVDQGRSAVTVDVLDCISLRTCASTNESERAKMLSSLLRCNPEEAEQLRSARLILERIEEMHHRLTTPLNYKAGRLLPEAETDEAIDFFKAAGAAAWLSDGFRGDLSTQLKISEALLQLTDDQLQEGSVNIVGNSMRVLSPEFAPIGSEGPMMAEASQRNVIKLLSERLHLELPPAERALVNADLDVKRAQWVNAIKKYLARAGN